LSQKRECEQDTSGPKPDVFQEIARRFTAFSAKHSARYSRLFAYDEPVIISPCSILIFYAIYWRPSAQAPTKANGLADTSIRAAKYLCDTYLSFPSAQRGSKLQDISRYSQADILSRVEACCSIGRTKWTNEVEAVAMKSDFGALAKESMALPERGDL
jgi:hypothetical protein